MPHQQLKKKYIYFLDKEIMKISLKHSLKKKKQNKTKQNKKIDQWQVSPTCQSILVLPGLFVSVQASVSLPESPNFLTLKILMRLFNHIPNLHLAFISIHHGKSFITTQPSIFKFSTNPSA